MKPERASPELTLLEPCLVVEDDSIILLDLEHTLRQLGFSDLRTATTLAKAQSIAADHEIRFAVLDYAVGKSNSVDIAETLVARGTPVVFLTAYGVDVELPAALMQIPVVSKPFTTAQLAKVLRTAMSAAAPLKDTGTGANCTCSQAD